MRKFKYLDKLCLTKEELNKYGEDGWELICVIGSGYELQLPRYFFKKFIKEQEED